MEKPYKCCHCSYSSSYNSAVKLHMRTHTCDKPYKCNQCSYASNRAENLKVHVRTHTSEKPYKCNQCPYSSAQSGTLKLHMRTHTSEKPYKCSQCSYASIQAGNLQLHMRTHTGEKPYKCRQCSYASNQAGNLQSHMRTHTNEKPYKCSQCSYASNHAGDLQTHMRTHTNEKPYKCSQCSYASNHAGNLQTHMRTHTGEKPYKCNQCTYACTQTDSLLTHMELHIVYGQYQAPEALSTQTKLPNIEQPQIEPLKTSSSTKPALVCAKCGQSDFWTIDDLETHIVLKHFRGIDALYKCLHPNCWALFPIEEARLRHARDVHLKALSEIPMEMLPQNQDKNFVSLRLAIHQCFKESITLLFSNSSVTNKESGMSKCSANANASYFVTSSTVSNVYTEKECDIKKENCVNSNVRNEGKNANLKPALVCAKCGQSDFWTIDDLETHIVLKHFRGIDALYKCLHPNCWALFPTEEARLRHARDVHLKALSEISMGMLPQNQDEKFVSLRLAIHQCLNESIRLPFSNSSVTNKESGMNKCTVNANASHFLTSSTVFNVLTEKECDIKEENCVNPCKNARNEGKIENLKASIIKEELM